MRKTLNIRKFSKIKFVFSNQDSIRIDKNIILRIEKQI